MISTADFKNGVYIKVGDKLFRILWFQHHKPGKGPAIMRAKLKDVINGATIERSFRGGEKFESPEVTRTTYNYSYSTGDELVFMDANYDQKQIDEFLGIFNRRPETNDGQCTHQPQRQRQ